MYGTSNVQLAVFTFTRVLSTAAACVTFNVVDSEGGTHVLHPLHRRRVECSTTSLPQPCPQALPSRPRTPLAYYCDHSSSSDPKASTILCPVQHR